MILIRQLHWPSGDRIMCCNANFKGLGVGNDGPKIFHIDAYM